jgi:hypothetical protein
LPQLFVFYGVFPVLFIASIYWYPMPVVVQLGLALMLCLVVILKANQWVRYWQMIETIHYDLTSEWYFIHHTQQIDANLSLIRWLPGMGFILVFQLNDRQQMPYIVFNFQLDEATRKGLTVYAKFKP